MIRKDCVPLLLAVAFFDVFIRLKFSAFDKAADCGNVDLARIRQHVGIAERDLRPCGAAHPKAADARLILSDVEHIAVLRFPHFLRGKHLANADRLHFHGDEQPARAFYDLCFTPRAVVIAGNCPSPKLEPRVVKFSVSDAVERDGSLR